MIKTSHISRPVSFSSFLHFDCRAHNKGITFHLDFDDIIVALDLNISVQGGS